MALFAVAVVWCCSASMRNGPQKGGAGGMPSNDTMKQLRPSDKHAGSLSHGFGLGRVSTECQPSQSKRFWV